MPRTRPPRQEGVQTSIVPGGAVLVRMEALLDPIERTVIYVVEAIDVPAGNLVALWSTPPRGFEATYETPTDVQHEFARLVREHSGPF